MHCEFAPYCILLLHSLSLSVLLVATGLWVPQKVEFVGSELVEGYESISTNPEDYKDQAVLILGKGNSAFETAQSILGRASRVHMLSSSPVRLAWQTHYVGDLRYCRKMWRFLIILIHQWFPTFFSRRNLWDQQKSSVLY